MTTKKQYTLKSVYPYILILAGIAGLIASFTLTMDKIHLLKDPNFIPNCNLNPIFSCTATMNTKQGEVFGFPNSLIGVIVYPVFVTVGAALLAGAQFKKWFWQYFQVGITAGMGFVLWMMYQSFVNIKTLCIFCMTTWASMLILFWYTSLYTYDEKYFTVPKGLAKTAAMLRRNHLPVIISVFLLIIMIAINTFWYYWKTLL